MAPQIHANVYAAALEINTSLQHLRQEQTATKQTVAALQDQLSTQQHHMGRIDELIDQHQVKIGKLMQMVLTDLERAIEDKYADKTANETSISKARETVPTFSTTQSTSPPIVVETEPLPGSERQRQCKSNSVAIVSDVADPYGSPEPAAARVKIEQNSFDESVPLMQPISAMDLIVATAEASTSTTVVPEPDYQRNSWLSCLHNIRECCVVVERIGEKKHTLSDQQSINKISPPKIQQMETSQKPTAKRRKKLPNLSLIGSDNTAVPPPRPRMAYYECCGRTNVWRSFQAHLKRRHNVPIRRHD